jgi:hypothetical protein
MGVDAGGSMVLRQPSRCRPPLGGHDRDAASQTMLGSLYVPRQPPPPPADACSDATARCAAAKLLLFAAPLLGAGDETSGGDEASVVPLTVGHAVSYAPSWRPRAPSPLPWTEFGSGVPNENMCRIR